MTPVAPPDEGDDLAAAVARADPADLLPARRRDEGVIPPEAWVLADALALDPGIVLAVLDDGARWSAAPLVVAGDGGVRRAAPGEGAAVALLRAVAEPRALPSPFSIDRWAIAPVGGPGRIERVERVVAVDQTNESVVVGRAAPGATGVVVKWYLGVGPPHPAVTMLAHLTAAGFTGMPVAHGGVAWRGPRGPVPLALVIEYLPAAEDGWDWYLREGQEWMASGGRSAPPTASAVAVGGLTARLHLALATPTDVIAEPVRWAGRTDVRAWHARAVATIDEALDLVTGDGAAVLRATERYLRGAVDEWLAVDATPVLPVHGDLHVGQVLRDPSRLVVVDFDGNPLRPPVAVPDRQPAARDLVGLLQSLDHLGRAAARRLDPPGDPGAATVDVWIAAQRTAALAAYRQALAGAGQAGLLDERLLAPLAAEQECHELVYAARHLPRWAYAPLATIAAMYRAPGGPPGRRER